jgi:hypothetical protein
LRLQSLIANLVGSNQAVRNVFGSVAIKLGMPIDSKGSFAGGPRPWPSSMAFPALPPRLEAGSTLRTTTGSEVQDQGQDPLRVGTAERTSSISPDHRRNLDRCAYETIPNKAIIAGKTKGPEDSAEQPATLGRLALGRK